MARVLTKYKPCFDESEYTGVGYIFNHRDGKWYEDVTLTNDDRSLDFSSYTPVTNLGIVGKAFIDAGGNVENASELEREMFFEYLKADKVKCRELEYTPVVYSGYLASNESTSDAIIQFTEAEAKGISVVAGIGIIEEAGLYEIEVIGDVYKNSTTSTDYAQLKAVIASENINGVIVGRLTASVLRGTSAISVIRRLNIGDTINIQESGVGAITIYANSTTLSIKKIGA